jgi:hypothetical protein
MTTVANYITSKIESEYYNLISSSLVERELDFSKSLVNHSEIQEKNVRDKKAHRFFEKDLMMGFRK